MKRCPQCNSLYSDEIRFCLNDGTELVEQNLSMPSEDSENRDEGEDTIIRHHPIVIDVAQPMEVDNQPLQPPPTETYQTIVVENQRNTGKYLLFLILGLLIGGGLVLATLYIARSSNQNASAVNVGTGNANQPGRATPSNQNGNSQVNISIPTSNANFESDKFHSERTSAPDDEFNGRVITINAYVRAAPSKSASEVSILPNGDRLNIGERENPNSPWYQVTCEHGTSGWMHGDTIEFTQ